MPTFTAIALDRFLEPGGSRPTEKSTSDLKSIPRPRDQASKHERRSSASSATLITNTTTVEKKYHWTQISPALYATPEVTPLPDSPSSFPPSPYIINHKRRGPRLIKSQSETNVSSHTEALDEVKVNGSVEDTKSEGADVDKGAVDDIIVPIANHVNGFHDEKAESNEVSDNVVAESKLENCPRFSPGRDRESDDFFDPKESMSYTSNTDGEDNGGTEQSISFTATGGAEFYDAWEELSSEGGMQLAVQDVDAELREMRLSLLMEIEKRKQAEDALNSMRSQWHRIREQLSLVGMTFPVDPTLVPQDYEHLDSDAAEDLCQQVYIARFVSDSIGRGIAKAEAEVDLEAQIASKNFEIARLCDRLHYYEAVNREMSHRNQEAVETARRLRQRRKRRKKWVWGSIAAAITLGTAALAWSYLPAGKGSSSSTHHSQTPEVEDAEN